MHKFRMKSFVPFVLLCGLIIFGATAQAQDNEPKYKTADTNNAVIRGRVTLPSGFAAETYARITLRNQQSILSTIYTNNSGVPEQIIPEVAPPQFASVVHARVPFV